jgi:hypothetical protein
VSKVVLCGYIWLLLITANSGFLVFWNQRTRGSRFLKEIKIKDSWVNPAISKPQRTTGFQKKTSKEPTIFWAVIWPPSKFLKILAWFYINQVYLMFSEVWGWSFRATLIPGSGLMRFLISTQTGWRRVGALVFIGTYNILWTSWDQWIWFTFGAKFSILATGRKKGVGNATKGFHWKNKWAHVAICLDNRF